MIALFDVDGVLVRSGFFSSWLKETYGLTRDHTSEFFQGPFTTCSQGKADLLDELSPYLFRWGIKESADELRDIWFELDGKQIDTGLALMEEVKSMGYTLGVATTQESYRKAWLIDNVDAIRESQHHFFSCDLGFVKPEPGFYQTISQRLSSPASVSENERRILFFDDIEANVLAAKEEGWQAFHYTGQKSIDDFPDLQI